ncbi:MAG: hypothetical protein L6Q71_02700 [Planctomycetes bacterium]|nr:hypothetical protein [Planctomycetota bacterium]NUQ35102.1 hypothetical protein [Planctomycetaceae bacterium]
MQALIIWIISGVLAALGFVLLFLSSPGAAQDALQEAIDKVAGDVPSTPTIKDAKKARDDLMAEINRARAAQAKKAGEPILSVYREASLKADELTYAFPKKLEEFGKRLETMITNPIGFNDKGEVSDKPYGDKGEFSPLMDLDAKFKPGSGGDTRVMRIALSATDATTGELKRLTDDRKPECMAVMKFDFAEFQGSPEVTNTYDDNDPYKRYTFSVLLMLDSGYAQRVIDHFAFLNHPELDMRLAGWSFAPPVYPKARKMLLTWEDYDLMGIEVSEDEKKEGEGHNKWRSDRQRAGYREERENMHKLPGYNIKLPVYLTLKLQVLEAKAGHPVLAQIKPNE